MAVFAHFLSTANVQGLRVAEGANDSLTHLQGTDLLAVDAWMQALLEQRKADPTLTLTDTDNSTPMLLKLTCPTKEAPKILRLLEESFVNGATLFPGYGGIIQGLQERAVWDRNRP